MGTRSDWIRRSRRSPFETSRCRRPGSRCWLGSIPAGHPSCSTKRNATSRELWLASWCHVYAARILDFLGLREEAVAEYQAAIKIGDVPEGAFREAQAGVAAPYVRPEVVKP